MTLEGMQTFAAGGTPDFRRVVTTATGDVLPVWIVDYRVNQISMSLEDMRAFAAGHTPDFHRFIITTNGDVLPVWTVGYRVN